MWSVMVPYEWKRYEGEAWKTATALEHTSMVWLRVIRKYEAAVSTMKLAIWHCASTITVALRLESGSMRHSSPNVAPGVSVATLAPNEICLIDSD